MPKEKIFLVICLMSAGLFVIGGCGESPNIPSIFGGNYSQNDDFKGPSAGVKEQDQDGIFNSLAINPDNADVVYMGTENNAIFKSTDGFATWEWLRNGLWHDERSYPEVYDITVDPDDPSLVYAALTNGPQPPDSEKAAGFYKSTNGGEVWERSVEGLPNTGATAVAVLENHKVLLLGLDGEAPSNDQLRNQKIPGGLYQSTDGGANWTAVPIPEEGVYNKYNRIVVRGDTIYTSGLRWGEEAPGQPRQIDRDNMIGFMKSTDRGQTWEKINPPNSFCYYFDVAADGQTIYCTSGEEGFKSTDSGDSWQELSQYFSNTVKVSPQDPDTVFFANGNQLNKSTDGMVTSETVLTAGGGYGFDDIEISPSNPNIVYAAERGYILHKSVDGGETFTEMANLREYIDST
ncbi:WD40/YVTN/BNR-like repeat-containing protein [Patescibacteria group bacterium]